MDLPLLVRMHVCLIYEITHDNSGLPLPLPPLHSTDFDTNFVALNPSIYHNIHAHETFFVSFLV